MRILTPLLLFCLFIAAVPADAAEPVSGFTGHAALISPSGDHAYIQEYNLYTGEYTTYLYDVQNKRKLSSYPHRIDSDFSKSVNFTPMGELMVTTRSDGTHFYHPRTGGLIRTLPESSSLNNYAFQPGGHLLALANQEVEQNDSEGYYLAVYDTRNYEKLYKINFPYARTAAAAFSPSEDILAAGSSYHDTISFYKASTGERLSYELQDTSFIGVDEIDFSPDGQRLYVRSENSVYLAVKADGKWKWKQERALFSVKDSHLGRILPSVDGRYLFSYTNSGFRIYDAYSGKLLVEKPDFQNMNLSLDQKWLIANINNYSTIQLFSTAGLLAGSDSKTAAELQAEKYLAEAEKYAGALKWQISVEYTKTVQYPDMSVFNLTKDHYVRAKNQINSLDGTYELEYRLANHVELHYFRAIGYIDAITSGQKIVNQAKRFNQLYSTAPAADGTEAAYHALSGEIRKQAVLLYRVYGQTTRNSILAKYKAPGEKALQSAQKAITVKMLIDDLAEASSADEKAELKKRIEMLLANMDQDWAYQALILKYKAVK
ncbi:WD40 repeat domain-containing protein [Bacillus sp. UMB0728]|uniref:WD40 repeat domain-containing protein n=1 Tax=Bacillus sp. UMB0728 TaxID=2066052 RepID=UPI000C794787|nr:WD40 repeat domain-containing protein [Bacillus sp. UMB0728]PLR73493.1 hypothetical protein CYJ37_08100 [Bacillus sp. UMB0728]